MIKACNRVIEYSFYGLFLLVPWAFTSKTSELFELNKMWLTWALTIIIVTAWIIKMVLQKRIIFQRTPLDIPIGLFLISQIISTIFSLDSHVSLWGYYSRFNGGLLSIISYIILYYAFVSNFVAVQMVKRLLFISLISGLVVALWGLPSHFGYDPTCLLFRGTLDVACWTADFIPTIRIFSTLGQPDWLAAYLAILIPIAIVFALGKWKIWIYSSLIALFYVDVLYTRARSGILGIWISLAFFAALYYWLNGKPKISVSKEKLKSPIAILFFGFLVITFIVGTPFNQLHAFSLEGIKNYFQKPANPAKPTESGGLASPKLQEAQLRSGELRRSEGGTESGDIRLNVWKGAINAWKENPIFGTGVETFAFAYYKYKPAEHNLTSEWNYLYNKAHNEYLNYLATTGVVGLGSYLLMIGYFLFLAIKKISKSGFLISNQASNSKSQLGQLEIRSIRNLSLALLASYISILITNFFGFSVVITNIYLFMIPAFVFVLGGMLPRNESGTPTSQMLRGASKNYESRNLYQWTLIFSIILASSFMILKLFTFWRADIAYALGYNLDRAGEYEQAYPHLHKAVQLRGSELVFKDELSINDAYIAAGLLIQEPPNDQKEQTMSVANTLIQEAISTSNEVISKSPNNAVFWKTRTRVFYTLSQVDAKYLPRALDAIVKASLLAPNDANIWYNLGVIYGQNNNTEKGIETLEKTVKLKPDYRDARFGLGLYYHTASMDEKAIAQMQYILDNINPQDKEAQESITNWSKL